MEPISLPDVIFMLLILLPCPLSGKFTVIGPQQPITALVGREATFHCLISPETDAGDMEVLWLYSQSFVLVHQYKNKQDYTEDQLPQYQGRTKFLRENISRGSVALRLYHIRPSDEGSYYCLFRSPNYYNEAEFQVYVAGTGSAPQIYIENDGTEGIQLVCTSTGWYPKPEVQWRNSQEEPLTSAPGIKREENELFSVNTSITVKTKFKESISCLIQNPFNKEEKEARISLADTLLPRITPWKVACIVIMVVGSITFSISIWKFYRIKKSKETLRTERETLKTERDDLKKKIVEMKLQGQKGLQRARKYRVDVTLDANTAHPYLLLKDNDKSVVSSLEKQDRPKCAERFDTLVCVLGRKRFVSGKFYWEVKVAQKTKWTLGVCEDSVCRHGEIQATPEAGFWTLCLKKGNVYQALSNPRTQLQLEEFPQIIGIYLDYEGGRISFYNVTDGTHIYTFHDTFKGTLRPYFYPGPTYGLENVAPLTILSQAEVGSSTSEEKRNTV